MLKKCTYILLALLLTACGAKSTKQQSVVAVRPSSFSADSAYHFVEAQMAFGPRVPNGKAHTDCARYLQERLWAYGAEVEVQEGVKQDYSGRPQRIYNIIGHFNVGKPGKTLLLCAHYDTRPWCDEEPEYGNRMLNVPGANDGASGVGVLLEVARQIGDSLLNAGRYTRPVDIVFFDCEDMGTPSHYTGKQYENTWCLGSQLWAERAKLSGMQQRYWFGILLDMVGDDAALFPREAFSEAFAGDYVDKVWRAAENLGYKQYFVQDKPANPITDDHYYINAIAGIPCIDVIHYCPGSATGFPAWWHTRGDTMDNISRRTLGAVGEVVMQVLSN